MATRINAEAELNIDSVNGVITVRSSMENEAVPKRIQDIYQRMLTCVIDVQYAEKFRPTFALLTTEKYEI